MPFWATNRTVFNATRSRSASRGDHYGNNKFNIRRKWEPREAKLPIAEQPQGTPKEHPQRSLQSHIAWFQDMGFEHRCNWRSLPSTAKAEHFKTATLGALARTHEASKLTWSPGPGLKST
jgi:hypothetical protein